MNDDGSKKTQLTFECEFDVMEYAIDGTRIVARWRGFEISGVERGSNRRRRDHFRGDDVED